MRRLTLRAEDGFTLAIAMGIMLIASIISLAAFQAARGDLIPSGQNSDRKLAYGAAQSGIEFYLAKLVSDPNYWQQCANGVTAGVADPVNQKTVSDASRKWRTLSGTGRSKVDYSIGLLPAKGTTCSTTDPQGTMINSVDGSFRIRSTGRYHGQKRSIITSFKRARFLDFLYFTNYETLPPSINAGGAACAQYRAQRSSSCTAINFIGGDTINGPLHTNDDLLICGNPKFGRTSSDNIHVSGAAPGHKAGSGCTDSANFVGTFRPAQRTLTMPPTNNQLRDLTTAGTSGPGYRLTGTQYIRLTGNTMVIDTPAGNPYTVNLPTNGVLYVDNGACSNPNNETVINTNYTETAGCANVYVSGTANKSITIGSAKDIIVAPTTSYTGTDTTKQFNPQTADGSWSDADLKVNGTLNTTTQQVDGSVQIGLVPQGFARVYHRVANNALASGVRNVRIDAAILSLDNSLICDNYSSGPAVGTLTVHGAIAQRFRGTVGTNSGGSVASGYLKNYWYDDRLKSAAPPFFLDPVNSAWAPLEETELVPAV